MTGDNWHSKPYYSLDAYCKNTYGEKLYKIALNAGLSCPNRDGTLGTGGCIFCSAGGSGDFTSLTHGRNFTFILDRDHAFAPIALPVRHFSMISQPVNAILPTFRPIPIPTDLFRICAVFMRQLYESPQWQVFLLLPDPTVYRKK